MEVEPLFGAAAIPFLVLFFVVLQGDCVVLDRAVELAFGIVATGTRDAKALVRAREAGKGGYSNSYRAYRAITWLGLSSSTLEKS